jgi:hypothetical protein
VDYYCSGNCPDPNDKEAWRQYVKCSAIAAAIILGVIGLVVVLVKIF